MTIQRIYIFIAIIISVGLYVVSDITPIHASSVPDFIRNAATAEDIPPSLLAAIIKNESNFDPNSISREGCVGLGQLCKTSAYRPNIVTQCDQQNGPNLCSPNCNTTHSNYNWCDVCTGSTQSCIPDDRFHIERNILESARILASKISDIKHAGCSMSTEAGIKTAIYAYDMDAGRITPAITQVGDCNDYAALWQKAREHFTPTSCTSDAACGGGNTCGTHPEFNGQICLDAEDPLGIVFSSTPIPLSKLERKRDDIVGSYVSNIYEDYLAYGGITPNNQFDSISLTASSQTATIARGIHIGFPNLLIKIPGLTFSSIDPETLIREEPNGGKTIVIPFLAEYIAAVYRYAVGVITILAGIGVLIGGIMYMTSGASNTQAQAISVIQKSIVGLLLAVSSYTVLNIINPDLVRLSPIEVPYIPAQPHIWGEGNDSVQEPYTTDSPFSPTTPIPGANGLGYGYNNVPYFGQGQGPWGSQNYSRTGCGTYRSSGCGPSSIAMVLRHYDIAVDPTGPGIIALETGARLSCPRGTSLTADFIDALKQTYHVEIEIFNDHDRALELLQNNIPLIISGPQSGYTALGELKQYQGHYMVLTGIDVINSERIIRVNDPGRQNPNEGIVYKTIDQQLLAPSRERYILMYPTHTGVPFLNE